MPELETGCRCGAAGLCRQTFDVRTPLRGLHKQVFWCLIGGNVPLFPSFQDSSLVFRSYESIMEAVIQASMFVADAVIWSIESMIRVHCC